MPAYMIFIREAPTADEAEMAEYRRIAAARAGGVEIKRLANFGRMETVEGAAVDGITLTEFATFEAAQAWYHGEGYQAAVAHRKHAADYRVYIVDGTRPADGGEQP